MTALQVTSAPVTAPPRSGNRLWRRLRLVLVVVAVLGVCLWLATALDGPADTTELSPDNAQATGTRALAQVLQDQGVTVHRAETIDGALRWDGQDTTILVIDPLYLSNAELERLSEATSDLVLAGSLYESLDVLTDEQVTESSTFGANAGAASVDCSVPEAQRAGTVTRSSTLLAPGTASGAVFCFGSGFDTGGQYALATTPRHEVRVFADPSVLINGGTTTDGELIGVQADGNAALALGALGRHHTLVWLLPSASGGAETYQASVWDTLPPWVPAAAGMLLLAAGVAAVWRGRRFGPLVREPLPVEVQAAETAYGRGRLYRSARAYGHAAAALRAGAAARMAARLGLQRSATPLELVTACAQATGADPGEIHALLYGSAPDSGATLTDLAHRLDQLESEVNRS